MTLKIFLVRTCLMLMVFFLVQADLPARAANRTALVIGNSHYSSAPLTNPANDARDVKAALEKLGFDVTLKIDVGRSALRRAVRVFGDKIRKGGVGLFYYAGHGVQIDGVNYMIPVGIDIKRKYDVEDQCLKMRYVMGAMEAAGNNLNIVILDACRDNPFRSFRGGNKGLARMDAPNGTIIAYATGPGKVAADGEGRNGTYTANLLKNLDRKDLTVHQMLNRTGLDVMKETKNGQVPWISSTPIEEYYLAKGSTVVDTPHSTQPETGRLKVLSSPSGADIQVDGTARGRAPVDISGLSAGIYRVSGSLNGHESTEKSIQVNAGRKAVLTLYLDPVKTSARLYVTPTPADAGVRIMNIPEKYYSGIGLKPGRYSVEVSHPGYETHSRWIEITGTNDIDLYVELSPETAPQQVVTSSSSTVSSSASGTKRAGEKWKEPVTGMEFVWVPGGDFMMGRNEGGSDEKPVHKVVLSGFWMGKYEVTQGQWQEIMGNNPSTYKKGNDFPVERISWKDANAFIKKFNSQAGRTFSLPSEAQWEYAARSGGKNQKYSGGDDVNRFAWYRSNSGGSTHKVGTKTSNDLGIYDMSGNVWEWCQDIYAKDAYKKHSRNNPIYAQGKSLRVFRGGGFLSYPAPLRCANRGRNSPVFGSNVLGFRVLRTN